MCNEAGGKVGVAMGVHRITKQHQKNSTIENNFFPFLDISDHACWMSAIACTMCYEILGSV